MQVFTLKNIVLWVGDLITVGLLTLLGFATHDNLDAGGSRMATTFFPVLVAWLFVALPAGLLNADAAAQPRSLLRAAWGMTLAGVLAVILRGLLLNRAVAPVFAVVLSGSAVIAILVWRFIFLFWSRRIQ